MIFITIPAISLRASAHRCLFNQNHVLSIWTIINVEARLAQSAERKALNFVVVGSSPTVGVFLRDWLLPHAGTFESASLVMMICSARAPVVHDDSKDIIA